MVDVWELNLADLASVRAFARRFCKEDRRLDLLVCNAGVMAPHERAETADGLEMQFQVMLPPPGESLSKLSSSMRCTWLSRDMPS